MNTSRELTMRFALRAAANGKLEDGWLYLPSLDNPRLDTACLLITSDEEDMQSIAKSLAIPTKV